jgi:hypothetical protein
LADMPHVIMYFDCSYNPNLYCLPLLDTMMCQYVYDPNASCGESPYNLVFSFDSTGISCLPNYPTFIGGCSISDFGNTPICAEQNNNNCFTTAISSITADVSQFSLSPNPASQFLHVTFPDYSGNSGYEIFSATGKLIIKNSVNQPEFNVDVSNLDNGLYLIELFQGAVKETRKFIKD